MKNENQLQKSYQLQKEVHDQAKERRVSNRIKQIEALEKKIKILEETKSKLIFENQNEKEFISFEEFKSQSFRQSEQSTKSTPEA